MGDLRELDVGCVIRMPAFGPRGSWRLWYVSAHRMGATREESLWELVPLDCEPGDPELCQVPAIILETHPSIEVVGGQWFRERFVPGNRANSSAVGHG